MEAMQTPPCMHRRGHGTCSNMHACTSAKGKVSKDTQFPTYTRTSIHELTLTTKGTIVYFFFNTHTDSHAQGPESRLAGFDYT